MTSTSEDRAAGDVRRALGGRYVVEGPLGEGAATRVYRGTDIVLGRRVAIKVLAPDAARDEARVARFLREATAAASLNHPNVVAIYDSGFDDGAPFVVTEYVDGRTLRAVLADEGALDPARAAEIAAAVCAALQRAHERGILHRGVEPANVLVAASGRVKVRDFATPSGAARYRAPEQAGGAAGDTRADVYALGAVLDEMLAGHPPAAGGPPPGVPRALEAAVLKATATDPDDRYQSAAEMLEALEGALAGLRAPTVPAAAADRTEAIAVEAAGTVALPLDEDTVSLPIEASETAALPARPPRRRALSLSARLLATYGMLVAATVLVVAGLAMHMTRTHLTRDLDARIAAVVRSFQAGPAQRVETRAALAAEARRWLAAQAFPEDQVVAVRTAAGEVLSSSGGIDLRRVRGGADLLLARESRWWELRGPDGGTIRALTVPLVLGGTQEGTLVVAASRERVDETQRTLLSRIALASGIGLAFSALLAFVTIRRTLRPLVRISRDVDAVQATGDLSRRVSDVGPADEVGRLADAFNRMLSRLAEAFRSQRRFVSDASHELRTPLTVARGQLELLQESIRSEEEGRSLRLATEELDRMGRIVEDLLLLARLDEGLPLALQPVEVELVLREALLRGMQLGTREASVQVEPNVYVLADPERLLQVLTNLVTNSVRHAGPQARLALAARGDGDRVRIEVSDDGPGIPPEDLPHVFERFYRGAGARTGAPGGAGLGLAIADSLVRAMGGTVEVRSRPGEGTTFTISLPAAPLEG